MVIHSDSETRNEWVSRWRQSIVIVGRRDDGNRCVRSVRTRRTFSICSDRGRAGRHRLMLEPAATAQTRVVNVAKCPNLCKSISPQRTPQITQCCSGARHCSSGQLARVSQATTRREPSPIIAYTLRPDPIRDRYPPLPPAADSMLLTALQDHSLAPEATERGPHQHYADAEYSRGTSGSAPDRILRQVAMEAPRAPGADQYAGGGKSVGAASPLLRRLFLALRKRVVVLCNVETRQARARRAVPTERGGPTRPSRRTADVMRLR